MSIKFDVLAKQFGLDLNHNGLNYTNPKTMLAHHFYTAHDAEITRLKQEVCDLTFAAKAFKHVLDNPVVHKIEEGTPV